MNRYLFTLLLPALILAGCGKDPDPTDKPGLKGSVTISPNTVSLTGEAHNPASQTLTVTCKTGSGAPDPSAAWTLASDQSWLKLSLVADGGGAAATLSGTGMQTVHLVVEENTETAERTAEITLNGGADPAATVIQAKPEIKKIAVLPNSVTLECEAGFPSATTLAVTCRKDNGDPDPSAAWTLVSSQEWLKLALDPNGLQLSSVSGAGSRTVYLMYHANLGTSARDALITLAGTWAPMAAVTQKKFDISSVAGYGTLPPNTTSYVGAFWRANQTGERVIKINTGPSDANSGPWSVDVVWYDSKWNAAGGDGVVLAQGGSPDPNIYKAVPGDAEGYPVTGTLTSISGSVKKGQDILFRIGLTRQFTAYNAASNPARYAVVLLTYGTPVKIQKIFLRQGQGDDYLMRPGDKDASGADVGGAENRSYARKFSPYNLTDPNGNTQTNYGSMTTSATGLMTAAGVFVDYPSKAGYFFQWNYSKRAFHPTVPAGAFTSWNGTTAGSPLWNAAANETCPSGYRRPQDGSTSANDNNGPVAGSEMRQSLWHSPQTGYASNSGNSVWGYYADGWFDRLEISNAQGSNAAANSAVSAATKDAAYVGILFFNPSASSESRNASIFFPAASSRFYEDGSISYAGYFGQYWTSSLYRTGIPWSLKFSPSLTQQAWDSCNTALSVRCIAAQ